MKTILVIYDIGSSISSVNYAAFQFETRVCQDGFFNIIIDGKTVCMISLSRIIKVEFGTIKEDENA